MIYMMHVYPYTRQYIEHYSIYLMPVDNFVVCH